MNITPNNVRAAVENARTRKMRSHTVNEVTDRMAEETAAILTEAGFRAEITHVRPGVAAITARW